jgi:Mor family transcriptional regulator
MVKHTDLISDILARVKSTFEGKQALTEDDLESIEKEVRADWGGDRYFVSKSKNGSDHSERNSRIMRDYLSGERLKLLERRYNLSQRRILQIIRPAK